MHQHQFLPFQVERATLEQKYADEKVLKLAEEQKVCFPFFLLSWILEKNIKKCINYRTCIIYLCLIGNCR